MLLLRIVAGVVGVMLVATTVMSAIRTFVLPRGDATRLSRIVFVGCRLLFNARMHFMKRFEERDRLFALFAPISLLVMPVVWLILVGLGYTLVYWSLGTHTWSAAVHQSGSALFTLGSAPTHGVAPVMLSFSEACLGLGLVALLIAYLPTMYGSFQRREVTVTLLEVKANSPPTAVDMLYRYQVIHGMDRLEELWPQWETWFADIEESHTSFGAMAFFRSPQPDRSWITAAGAVLDAASLMASSIEHERTAAPAVCIRAGYVALRGIADFFDLPYDPDPRPDGHISITRYEYEQVCDRLAGVGVPIKPDRDQAWYDFVGWRVNYDEPLLGIAGLVMAPPAPWSSDRSRVFHRPPVFNRNRRNRRNRRYDGIPG